MASLPPLSKSKYTTGVQCLKRLWLQINEPGLLGETDPATQFRFDQGKEVGEEAQLAFPGGVLIENAHENHAAAVRRTQKLMSDRRVPAVFEAAFTFENIGVRVDILKRVGRERWRLIEVKSSTQVKPEHLPDIAIQKHVLQACGVKLAGVALMHLNSEYIYRGGPYRHDQLFAITDVSKQLAEAEAQLPDLLKAERAALRSRTAPDIDPGPQCTKPYQCEFYDHCNPALPADHVSLIPRISSKRLSELLELGCKRMTDVPDEFPLSEAQRRICQCVKTRRPYFGPGLARELAALSHPLFFMDFETLALALPRWEGTRPYEQVPFQFAIDVQPAPDGKLVHHEFLADASGDPRPDLIREMVQVFASYGRPRANGNRRTAGTVIVYNQSMEAGVLERLADWNSSGARPLTRVRSQLWDLLALIRGQVCHPEFGGSYSLKCVLPVLTGRNYDNLEVADGEAAGLAFMSLMSGSLAKPKALALRRALLKYCGIDTRGMFDILTVLHKAARR